MSKKGNTIEKEFLATIFDTQSIIHKVCKIYRDTKEDQEDLFQEIVYQLWKSYPGFKGESKVSSWIYRVALNTAIAVYRKQKIPEKYFSQLPEEIHPTDINLASENQERLFWGLRQLGPADKAIIALYLDDFTYQEMAAITGLSESNIGVRLNRIKNKLKHLLN